MKFKERKEQEARGTGRSEGWGGGEGGGGGSKRDNMEEGFSLDQDTLMDLFDKMAGCE